MAPKEEPKAKAKAKANGTGTKGKKAASKDAITEAERSKPISPSSVDDGPKNEPGQASTGVPAADVGAQPGAGESEPRESQRPSAAAAAAEQRDEPEDDAERGKETLKAGLEPELNRD